MLRKNWGSATGCYHDVSVTSKKTPMASSLQNEFDAFKFILRSSLEMFSFIIG